jgi:phage-related protein
MLETGAKLLGAIIDGILDTVPELLRNAGNLMKDLFNTFKSKITDFASIGKNIVSGIWSGIQSATSWIKERIAEFGSTVMDAVKDVFGIHSPSAVMRDEVGKYLAQGIGVGFEKEMRSVSAQMARTIPTPEVSFGNVAAGMVNSLQTALTGASGLRERITIEVPVVINGRELYRHTINDLRAVERANPAIGAKA